MKKEIDITVSGILGGTIWYPQVKAAKTFDVKFSNVSRSFHREWDGLRNAILHVTDDGDFQNCNIVEATMTVEFYTEAKKGTEKRTYSFELGPNMKQIGDMFVPTEDYYEYMDCLYGE